MLNRLNNLLGMSIATVDGNIGKIRDVYFDDRHWAVRYMVVDTGGWLERHEVLISPVSVAVIDWDERTVRVGLTRQQVEDSPDIDTVKPVSRQFEKELLTYYGYPEYWGGPLLWGAISLPDARLPLVMPDGPPPTSEDIATVPEKARHLQSMGEVTGYYLRTTDGEIGHVADFLLEQDSWAIRYLVIDTRNWWPGKHVVIPPDWIVSVDWPERTATTDVTREVVKEAPPYDPAVAFSREAEEHYYRHYNRKTYW
jgi:uncharacterized protein YrrD